PVNSADTAGVTLGTSTARYGFDYTRATADPQSATLYSVAENYALDGGKYDGENAVPTVYAAWNEAGLLPGRDDYDAGNMTKAGYTFDGWEITSEGASTPETGINNSLTCSDLAVNTDTTAITLTAQWTANDDTPYIVEHYLISSAGTVKNTENLTGTTDTSVTATAKNYAGYRLNAAHSDAVPTGTIAGDGTLVLKLYYQINTYIVTFTDGQGTTLKTQIVEYGNAAAAPAENPGRDGYIFDGWDREFGRVTGNLVITAQWSEASGEDSGTENNTNTPTPPQPGTDTNGGSGSGGGGSTPTADAGTPAQARTGTTGAPGNATAATATGTEIGDTDTPLSDVPGNDVGSENDADKGPAPSTDTEINPSDTPLAGGSGQASALGTALPIAGAALAAALLSIFFILFLRRRKRDEEEA
ncbi:MAG: InlB B-repeat-containing protein, partial [Clostridiales Family XIII bacterium]|nr:InlB B-repeat-containing protein [Clostridiales Family XIII bacterium]